MPNKTPKDKKTTESWEEVAPMGVSQWKNFGIRMGYWDFHFKKVRQGAVEEKLKDLRRWILERPSLLIRTPPEIITRITYLLSPKESK